MPAGQGKDAERFAAAVESRTPLGAAGDADLARELEIVAMLRSRGAAFAPDAETKARAKQRLMAVLAAENGGPRPAPRPVAPLDAAEMTAPLGRPIGREDVDPTAETTRMAPVTAALPADRTRTERTATEDDDATAVEPIPLHGARSGRRRSRHSLPARSGSARRSAGAALRRRVVLVSSAAAAAMLAIAGGGVLASKDSLPGDSLYAVKRVAEDTGLALTFDDAARARRQLEIAATRLSEVEQLAARDGQAEPAPEVYTEAMDDFEVATDEGARLLLASASEDPASTAESDLRTWAAEQSERLAELQPALPAAADAESSMLLLERLLDRTGGAAPAPQCDGEDCDTRQGDEENGTGSSAAENGTTRPDDEGSASETDEPSRTPTRTGDREDDPQLLPDLGPDAGREDEEGSTGAREGEEDSTATSEPDSGDGGDSGNVEVPLPLLPPVTLPPLLPGMPGITIG